MGSGASVRSQREQEEVEDDGEMFGLRGKKFRLKNNPVLMGTKMKKRKKQSFLSKKIFGARPVIRNQISDDFTFANPTRGQPKNDLTGLGPNSNMMMVHANKFDIKYTSNKSMNRDDYFYDPLLAFRLDCTSLAAVLIQRLVRGHLARGKVQIRLASALRFKRMGKNNQRKQEEQEQISQSTNSTHSITVVPLSMLRDETNIRQKSKPNETHSTPYPESPSVNGSPSSTTTDDSNDNNNNNNSQSNITSSSKSTEDIGDDTNNKSSLLVVANNSYSQEIYQEIIEMYKQKAITAKRAGDTAYAIENMQKYKTMKENNNGEASSDCFLFEGGTYVSASPLLLSMIHEGSIALVEDYKCKAIGAKKAGDTRLAINYMTKYKALQRALAKDKRQESSSATTPPSNFAATATPTSQRKEYEGLTNQIETAKKAAISAKRAGDTTTALTHMKSYKSLIVRQRSMISSKKETPLKRKVPF